jgi:DUF2075 family protein
MTGSEIRRVPFDKDAISVWAAGSPLHQNWPVVYTINNESEIYVGETTNVELRIKQHLAAPAKQNLKVVSVILDDSFNKSVCLDLESHLIRYFAADDKYVVTNGNGGITDSDYFDREKYRQSFDKIFEQLVSDGTLTRSIPDIVNSDLFKYSPFKALNTDQAVAVSGVLEFLAEELGSARTEPIVIQGDPGTGKTIVAIYLQKLIRDIARSEPGDALDMDSIFADYFVEGYRGKFEGLTIAFVIPQASLRASVAKVFRRTPGMSRADVMSPFELAESTTTYDLVIVDEAHRLQHRANQSSAALNKKFADINHALFGHDDKALTQLDWIIAKSQHQILLVDSAQSIKPADLPLATTTELIDRAKNNHSHFRLASQMRVSGGADYIAHIGRMLSNEVVPHSRDFGPYEFQLFDDFGEMRDAILDREHTYGLSRIVAGFAWPWISKTNKSLYDIEIDGVEMQWNQTATDWINSATSLDEVGSIHTVQGYDLNYAGVVIGNDLGWDEANQTLVFRRDQYFDVKGKENNPTLGKFYSDQDLLDFVTNIYRVLLTRGVRGTFVYVMDPALRERLRVCFRAS